MDETDVAIMMTERIEKLQAENKRLREALDKAIDLIYGVHDCPFIYNGIEMKCGCENCCEVEPSEEQMKKCWKQALEAK